MKIELKNKLINILMKNGNKKTSEKILLKSLKILQKLSIKKHTNLIQLAVVNSTPTFKINKQNIKKGKRKSLKETPIFIKTSLLRTTLAIKCLKDASYIKNFSLSYFAKNFSQEILSTASLKSNSIEKKNILQKQILINKKYFFKFKW